MESRPATPAHRQPGSQYGKFSLVARLATGGMAEIFLARLVGAAGFEKLVCIKRILPHLARDKQFVEMFLSEARIAAQISHPNVCQVFELGEIDGSYYIAMEYLEGVPLACFRRHDHDGLPPAPRLVAGIAIQACEGLHHAHGLKYGDGSVMEVVHRDVSPQNLFVTADGIVKVLDFGIAKIHGATVRTSTGAIKGTYAYMAPEQLRGERVDRRTDVFALGIAMWEILARRYLFKRETEFLTFQAITSDPIPDICALRPDVPTALSSVIMTALARNRDERFPSARMFGEAIAAAVSPMTSIAISDAVQRAFATELAEQAELIRVARAGSGFDLDVELGPSVGSGEDALTTPISQQRGTAGSQVSALALTLGSAPKTEVSNPALPIQRRSWGRLAALGALAVVVGGAGAFVYARIEQPSAPTAAQAPALPPPPPASTTPAPPATPPAAPPAPEQTPAPPPATPPPAAPPPVAKPVEKHTSAPRPAPPAARPSGPPGFITIDSTPVYAVIYIDGKSYGETPLVRVELSPGRHVVHAVAPSGATRDVKIVIESGKIAPASRIIW
jgi:serine/threonine-protein kinase